MKQKKNLLKKSNAVTLISLIITIIVMLILAGVSLAAVVGDNGVLTQAIKASLVTRYAQYLEEIGLDLMLSEDTPTYLGEAMRTYIPSMKDEDLEDFMVLKGELYYIGSDEDKKNAAIQVGINTDLSGGIANEVMKITENVVFIEEETDYLGIKLLDKNAINSETWKLAIDYNGANQEIARYGTGYYLLEPDVEYTIENESGSTETVKFSDYYLINYETDSLISTNNVRLWDINSTLAVTEGLVLNIDPTNMENIDYAYTTGNVDEFGNTEYDLRLNGVSTGIKRYGDIAFNPTTKSLMFNESTSNPTGEGGYMTLKKTGVDFKNGFSFEIYANLSRFKYNNGDSSNKVLAYFCRIPTLNTSDFMRAMRFAYSDSTTVCKFNNGSSWYGNGNKMSTTSAGEVHANACGYNINEDFYLTFVYTAYDSTKSEAYKTKHYDEYMINNGVDKIEYYINGILYGYTYYGSDSYVNGCNAWNNDSCPFFLGVVPWNIESSLYYLKGSVYTCRLYEYPMSVNEVKNNHDTTIQYRNSFK